MINKVILASKSGVRKKILNQNGIACEVLPANVDEEQVKDSLLKEKKIFCSTLILSNGIDQGKILLIKKYSRPKNIFTIDKKYDDFIRSKNLLYVLKNFLRGFLLRYLCNNWEFCIFFE